MAAPCSYVECNCPDWQDNMSILNTPWMLGLAAVGGYTGKKFKYCPWCGSKLAVINIYHNYNQCNCGTLSFRETTGGCPVHGCNEWGISTEMV